MPAIDESQVVVNYGKDVPSEGRLASAYSIGVIRRAASMAGMSAAIITSTIRLPEEQASIMYRNAVKSLSGQYKLYGATGDRVLDVYKANKGKSKEEVVAAMTKKIEDLLGDGRLVSRHVTTAARYALLNVIDIGVNSTRVAAGASFNLDGMTSAFAKLEKDGFIKKFIDETKKSNTCWHVEIVPNAKPL